MAFTAAKSKKAGTGRSFRVGMRRQVETAELHIFSWSHHFLPKEGHTDENTVKTPLEALAFLGVGQGV